VEEEDDPRLVLAYTRRREIQDIVLPTVPSIALPSVATATARAIEEIPAVPDATASTIASNRQAESVSTNSSAGTAAHPANGPAVELIGVQGQTPSNAAATRRPAPKLNQKKMQSDSGESPFMQGIITTARELTEGDNWFWLLLLLLVATLLTIYVRGRSRVRRRSKAYDD